MVSEIKNFQDDLLKSMKRMRQGKAARVTQVELSEVSQARAKVGLSQQAFAYLLAVSVRTLYDREQGRRSPAGAAKTLLKVELTH